MVVPSKNRVSAQVGRSQTVKAGARGKAWVGGVGEPGGRSICLPVKSVSIIYTHKVHLVSPLPGSEPSPP
mgnify:CR=1 FL=1